MGGANPMTAPCIRFDDVSIGYGHDVVIDHLSGTFRAGSLTAIVGPNGSGKSTILKVIMGHIKPFSGSIDRGGASIREFVYLPQVIEFDRQFPITVADVVIMGGFRQTGAFKGVSRHQADLARAALNTVGMQGLETSAIASLSGGQLQRVLFARLILQNARAIVLDEPFAGIDARTVADLISVIEAWHAAGCTVVAVLHDVDLVREHFPEALLVARKVIGWGPTRDVLSQTILARESESAGIWNVHASRTA